MGHDRIVGDESQQRSTIIQGDTYIVVSRTRMIMGFVSGGGGRNINVIDYY